VNIKDTIAAINQMQADGVIKRYAIGGAVARPSILNLWPRSTWTSSSISARSREFAGESAAYL